MSVNKIRYQRGQTEDTETSYAKNKTPTIAMEYLLRGYQLGYSSLKTGYGKTIGKRHDGTNKLIDTDIFRTECT